jgi:hypothetical protein
MTSIVVSPSMAKMTATGVRAVTATCEACGREADVDVDALPETMTVPKAGQWLRCSRCGGKCVLTRPAGIRGDAMVFRTLDQNARRRADQRARQQPSGRTFRPLPRPRT